MFLLLSSAGSVQTVLHNIIKREQGILQNLPHLQHSSDQHRISKMVNGNVYCMYLQLLLTVLLEYID